MDKLALPTTLTDNLFVPNCCNYHSEMLTRTVPHGRALTRAGPCSSRLVFQDIEIRARAERRAGELLIETEKRAGSRGIGKKWSQTEKPHFREITASPISKDQSSK
jgi:hypothetical protein